MTPVERIARKLCDDMPARIIAGREFAPSYEDSADHVQQYWQAIAQAALSALLEPSEAMVEAGALTANVPESAMIEAWQAMITAAIAEGRGE